jgi:hypothetical protein
MECTGIFRSCTAFDVGGFFPVSTSPLRGSDPLLHDFEATGINRSSGTAVFQLQLAGIEMYRADLRKRRKSHETRYNLRPPTRHDGWKAIPTTRSDVFRYISSDDPSGALDVILNSDRHVFF